jgi:phospholipid/cholesterol/gamma-HCH transport system substrate-binding protein
MTKALREHGAEALIGLLVIIVAVWFVVFAWERTGGGAAYDAIPVTAQFQSASGIRVGTDVRIAGIKVGTVTRLTLDPKTYMANVALALNPGTRVPSDSSLAVSSEGLLGGSYLAFLPGGDPTPLKAGDTIVDTQGSLDLNSLIGQFINKSGGSGGGAAASGAGASATPKP